MFGTQVRDSQDLFFLNNKKFPMERNIYPGEKKLEN